MSADLFKVYEFAKKAHEGQRRKTGEDYITHPIASAKNARQYGADKDTIAACVLHDIPEDTYVTVDQIETEFGKDIAFLVEGVTNVGTEKESLAKTISYAEQDRRVALVRLADRIHNTQTTHNLEFLKKHYAKTNHMFVELGRMFGYDSAADQLEKVTNELSTKQAREVI